ncbi:thioredoxin family protein [Salisediminibacterium selenitireducens]|uniref:Thioredoxin n=1 Tax=Bacillus selenitireducens (strain ATCC 700615 / DSM 15326 / MLS10) TaxID=439292 RepID=D6XYL0_BACIE|nr:thioredoxin family protein [Salisediminibacterium selenitireducens]ADI00279.1 thioredoxin [[Bacillus] selenitireducens MLS10]
MDAIQTMEELQTSVNDHEAYLLLIKTENCSVCEAVEEQINQGVLDEAELPIGKVRLKDIPEVSGEFLVFTSPTLILFLEGKEQWRGSRFVSYDEIIRIMKLWRS